MKLHDLKPNRGSKKNRKRVGRGPGSGYGTGAGSDMGSAPSYGSNREVNVSITLKEGTSGLFNAVVEENDRSSQAGYDSFAKAS